MVFGPDGNLYVAADQQSDVGAKNNTNDPLGGFIVKVNTTTGVYKVLASEDGVLGSTVVSDLHRPEGLVFGPDGNLYVTSFRDNSLPDTDPNKTDKILVLNGSTGKLKDEIALDQAGQPRAYAQDILFGPGDSLFVPITAEGQDTGSVRRYDVSNLTHVSYTTFIAPSASGGPLGSPWYLTFGQTDPATLAYNPDPDGKTSPSLPIAQSRPISPNAGSDPSLIEPLVDQALAGLDSIVLPRKRSVRWADPEFGAVSPSRDY